MSDIVLATINARYIHSSLGLRSLHANLGQLAARAEVLELTDRLRPVDLAERILASEPRILGLGVYIWNARVSRDLVAILKRLRPELVIVLGGPEVSFEADRQEIVELADHLIEGEGEVAFRRLCEELLAPEPSAEAPEESAPVPLDELELPYDGYTDADLAHRFIYVEASRGCPFGCEFCLSSRDPGVRRFPLGAFLAAMERLLERGASQLRFVDRTFNLDPERARHVLEFFLERYRPGMFLHFEALPDRFDSSLGETIRRFPAGALQLELGIQSLDPRVCALIGRRQDAVRVREAVRFLRRETEAHLHVDLILGLPSETLEGFAAGFDELVGWDPQEIQVGVLKKLRGAAIARHDREFGMVYSDRPPYEVLCTDAIDFATMQRLKRFSLVWDRMANSGNFAETAPWIWRDGSPFRDFLAWCDWLYARWGRVHSIALERLVGSFREYLLSVKGEDPTAVRQALIRDYTRSGRTRLPASLRHASPDYEQSVAEPLPRGLQRAARQGRHRGTGQDR